LTAEPIITASINKPAEQPIITELTNKPVRPITASTNKMSHSTDDLDLSFHQHTSWVDDSNNSINSSFWNYPLQYQSHDKNETVY